MYQLHWIKLSTDLFGNPKIRCLMALPEGQSAVLLWVFLLTAAGRTNDGGHNAVHFVQRRNLRYRLGANTELAPLWQLAQYGILPVCRIGHRHVSHPKLERCLNELLCGGMHRKRYDLDLVCMLPTHVERLGTNGSRAAQHCHT